MLKEDEIYNFCKVFNRLRLKHCRNTLAAFDRNEYYSYFL